MQFSVTAVPSDQVDSEFISWTEAGVRVNNPERFELELGQEYDLTAHFNPFLDVSGTPWAWAQIPIVTAHTRGIVNGMTNGQIMLD